MHRRTPGLGALLSVPLSSPAERGGLLGGGRPRLAAIRALVLASILTLVVVSLAYAKFGSSYSHICDTTLYSECVANNAYHSVYVNVAGSYATQVRWSTQNYTSVAPPIVMSEVYPPALDKAVEVLLTNAGANGALAWTQCASGATYGGSDALHTRWCRPQRFYYNTYYEAGYFPTDNAKRYIACHELGHTIGLQHPASGERTVTCMTSATITPKYVPTYTTTSDVERSQVYAYYSQ